MNLEERAPMNDIRSAVFGFCLLLGGSAPIFAAIAEPAPMRVGPVTVQVPVKDVSLSIVGQGTILAETRADHSELAVRLSAQLDDLERQAAGLARAAGLDIDECHGAPVNVRVESGELQPAAPDLVLALHGKVRGWICKPFKTQLTPELDVDARTTLSIDVSAQHVVTIVPSSTRIDVRRLDNLGAVGGPIRSVIGSLENKVQAELAAELARHALPLDKLAAPFSISSATAEFSGKSLVVSLSGALTADAATNLAGKLITGAVSK
jgi:hypothetical protein